MVLISRTATNPTVKWGGHAFGFLGFVLVFVHSCETVLFTINCDEMRFLLFTTMQEEHDQIRMKKRGSSEALEWSDYKSMPFTQCVSITC